MAIQFKSSLYKTYSYYRNPQNATQRKAVGVVRRLAKRIGKDADKLLESYASGNHWCSYHKRLESANNFDTNVISSNPFGLMPNCREATKIIRKNKREKNTRD